MKHEGVSHSTSGVVEVNNHVLELDWSLKSWSEFSFAVAMDFSKA